MKARKEVSHLTTRDLLLLDTKAATIREHTVAFCSIFLTLHGTIEKAGGPEAFIEVTRELGRSRGWQAVVCLFKAKENRKGLACVSVEGESSQALCEAFVPHFQASPGNFSASLKENDLFKTQGLVEHGFQLQALEDVKPLLAFTIKGEVSRKTLLPFAASL